jgi:hypothetical protein
MNLELMSDPKYVKMSTPSNLKSSIVKIWRYLVQVEDIFMYLAG